MDDSHPFRSMLIGHPIPEIKLFRTLTLKFQLHSQGHGCGQRARSYNRPSIILTHLVFISHHHTNNSWDRPILKFDLETSKVKVMSEVKGQGHILHPVSNRCTSFLFHINLTNHSWDMAKIVLDLEKTHPKLKKKKIAKIRVSNRNFPKYNKVMAITSAIKLPCFVVIRWVVLTISCRQANFC